MPLGAAGEPTEPTSAPVSAGGPVARRGGLPVPARRHRRRARDPIRAWLSALATDPATPGSAGRAARRRPRPRPRLRPRLTSLAVLAVALVLGAVVTPDAVYAASPGIPGSEVDPGTLPGVLRGAAPPPTMDGIGQVPILTTTAPATEPLAAADLQHTMIQTGGITPLAAAQSAVIEDTNVGAGVGRVSYGGNWTVCGGCMPSTPNRSFEYSLAAGDTATVQFTGTQVRIYGVKERAGGLASVQVDNGSTTNVDTYAPNSSNALLYDSGTLPNGVHTAVLTNLGQRNAASAAFAVSFDRAEIFTDPGSGSGGGSTPPTGTKTTIEDTAIGPDSNQVVYNGNWTRCGGCVPSTPNRSFRYSLTAGATTTIRWTGNRILIYGVKEQAGGLVSVSVDGRATATVDTYAPTSSNTLIYDSGQLSFGDHIAVVTNIGQRNSASAAFAVSFDRAETYTSADTGGGGGTGGGGTGGGNRSGQPWLSGANGDPLITPQDVDGFCSFRGDLCDIAQVYVARDSWASIVRPSFAETNFNGWPGKLVLTVPPFPEDHTSNLATCATGAYNSYWQQFGRTLNSTGRQNSIVRLAWEANGDWYPWAGTNASDYINCFRQVVNSIRSTTTTSPQFDWTINAHYSQNPPSHVPTDLYPGDQWVDIVSIDAYDHFPPSFTLDQFNDQAEAMGGITWLYNFARAHGKLFGVPEWGVASGSGDDGGGDNASYIQFMRDWMVARAGHGMYYESYFNNCEMENVGSNLFRPVGDHCLYQNTAAATRYAQLW
ncbi:endoglucanase [Frankia sp. AgB1.9]|nr:endoglucanase [Frankia sp. AgW1.1]MBL7551833.1 endoglucanase [Frankia sp. AgB1.9]MBL7624816.1 endoglucanase [Frankia sp. AgB1.8]